MVLSPLIFHILTQYLYYDNHRHFLPIICIFFPTELSAYYAFPSLGVGVVEKAETTEAKQLMKTSEIARSWPRVGRRLALVFHVRSRRVLWNIRPRKQTL